MYYFIDFWLVRYIVELYVFLFLKGLIYNNVVVKIDKLKMVFKLIINENNLNNIF